MLVLIFLIYYKDLRFPKISGFFQKKYKKARFKIWDDLSAIEKGKSFVLFKKICFKVHKLETSLFKYLVIFFQSKKDDFSFLDCDILSEEASECSNEDYQKIKKRISFFSMLGLVVLIIINILIAFIISQFIIN